MQQPSLLFTFAANTTYATLGTGRIQVGYFQLPTFHECSIRRICSIVGQGECPCAGIPPWPRTESPPQDCNQLNGTFRYTCLKGYVRTAGTSNLIKCNPGSSQWSSPTLDCKPDPRGGAAHVSNSTDAGEHTTELERKWPKIDAVTPSGQNDTSPSQSSAFTSGSGITTIAVVCSILGAAVVLIGIGLLLRKRRAQVSNPLQTAAEGIPLNEATSR
ncbi:interleukin-15 receptor subunit alpha isoform X2 [Festucalex cinctus]